MIVDVRPIVAAALLCVSAASFAGEPASNQAKASHSQAKASHSQAKPVGQLHDLTGYTRFRAVVEPHCNTTFMAASLGFYRDMKASDEYRGFTDEALGWTAATFCAMAHLPEVKSQAKRAP